MHIDSVYFSLTVQYSNPLEIVQYILVSITVDSASNGHTFLFVETVHLFKI